MDVTNENVWVHEFSCAIISDLPVLREILIDGENALLVPPKNVKHGSKLWIISCVIMSCANLLVLMPIRIIELNTLGQKSRVDYFYCQISMKVIIFIVVPSLVQLALSRDRYVSEPIGH